MITVKEEIGDLTYLLLYNEPLFSIGSEKTKFSVLNKIMSAFNLNLNNIKFNGESPADRFISFNKFDGDTFIDISIGLQELAIRINKLQDEQQGYEIIRQTIGTINKLKGFGISNQKITLSQHYSSEDDSDVFFDNLNPVTPDYFNNTIENQGVVYKLFDSEINCHISLLVDSSRLFQNGIFINADLNCNPNKFTFNEMFKYAKQEYSNIINALGMTLVD